MNKASLLALAAIGAIAVSGCGKTSDDDGIVTVQTTTAASSTSTTAAASVTTAKSAVTTTSAASKTSSSTTKAVTAKKTTASSATAAPETTAAKTTAATTVTTVTTVTTQDLKAIAYEEYQLAEQAAAAAEQQRNSSANAYNSAAAELDRINGLLDSERASLDELRNGSSELIAKYSEGSFGFFEAVGAEEAITALNTAQYASSTVRGDPNDATSLTNMKAAFDLIRECNDLRRGEGKGDLMVSDKLMAIAQSNLNWSDGNIGHSSQFWVGENLSWNYPDPFEGWYYEEKPYNGGHYRNIIRDEYIGTGFAVCTAGRSGAYQVSHGQVFALDASMIEEFGPYYTVDEYEKRFDDYSSSVIAAYEQLHQLEGSVSGLEGQAADQKGYCDSLWAQYEQDESRLAAALSVRDQRLAEYNAL